MKIVRLKGGLGNQIFQIMYALRDSRLGEKIIIDVSFFKRQFEKDYAGQEELVAKVLSKQVMKRVKIISMPLLISNVCWKFVGLFISSKSLLDGYFNQANYYPQTINYREYFDISINAYEIDFGNNSVLIHVRKGDYLNNINSKIYYDCDQEYYIEAVRKIELSLSNPKYYIVSNDNCWVRKNFTFLKSYKIIEVEDPVEVFKIMSNFSNFIIPNSTFSWWPALISGSSLVVVPKKWFRDDALNDNLYPEKWIQI